MQRRTVLRTPCPTLRSSPPRSDGAKRSHMGQISVENPPLLGQLSAEINSRPFSAACDRAAGFPRSSDIVRSREERARRTCGDAGPPSPAACSQVRRGTYHWRDDSAVHLEFDERLRFGNRVDLNLEVGRLHFAGGDISRDLQHPVWAAATSDDRFVGGLQPDLTAALAEPLKSGLWCWPSSAPPRIAHGRGSTCRRPRRTCCAGDPQLSLANSSSHPKNNLFACRILPLRSNSIIACDISRALRHPVLGGSRGQVSQ
jgi:hypothetical protein